MTRDHGPTAADLPAEERLAVVLHALWRAGLRATRATAGLPTMAESQIWALRKLIAAGGLTPAELAVEMHLARPTVSNLIRGLVADGFIERIPSATDGRSVVLVALPRAHELLEAFGRGRVDVVATALAGLTATERRQVVAAVPALEHLLRGIEAQVDPQVLAAPDHRPVP